MKYRWILRPVEQPEVLQQLQNELNKLPEPLARALLLRGIDNLERARRYFRPSLEDLHDPFLMQDMDEAVDRVIQAIQNEETLLVFGDYDVDGTTSTALLTAFLREVGANVDYYVPDRFEDGYGLGETGIDYAAEIGAGLIIAVDCGVTAIKEALYARAKGIDLIICDHHTPKDTLPEAIAVLDPKREDCEYPFKELSGCGVSFKLVQAILERLGKSQEQAFRYLDLVALSTASDIVPICGENRVLMAEGLQILRQNPRLGFRKLAEQAHLDFSTCTTSQIVFSIGPRINAAGRLGDACQAVALLLEQDEARAFDFASNLEQLNLKRRTLDRETLNVAVDMAQQQLADRTRYTIVLHRPEWHLGVIGIVASRLVERFYRPTIMMCTNNGRVKGSARSIGGLNIYQALEACKDVLIEFGGHNFAAGLSLHEEDIPSFQQCFEETVSDMITPDILRPVIEIDASLDLNDIDDRFWAVLKQFAPFGPQNTKPVFQASDLELAGQPHSVGRENAHLRFKVRQRESRNGRSMDVIGFNMGKQIDMLFDSQRQGLPIDLLFSIEENYWKGRTTLQLKARDLRLGQDYD